LAHISVSPLDRKPLCNLVGLAFKACPLGGSVVIGALDDHLPSTRGHHNFAFGAAAVPKNSDFRNISFEDAHPKIAVARVRGRIAALVIRWRNFTKFGEVTVVATGQPVRAAGPHDQAHRTPRDHAV
jgi:hypothetical protein